MRLLIVSPVATDPVNAGNRARIVTMTRLFQHWGLDVHFAFVPMQPADLGAMRLRFGAERTHVLQYTQPLPSWPVRALRKLARLAKHDAGYLWALDAWYDPGLTEQLKALHTKHHFDAVCVEYVFMSKALDAFPTGVRKALDTHDCFAWRHRRYLQQGEEPQWFSTTNEDELRAFRRAEAVLAIQPQEAESFAQRLGGGRSGPEVIEFGHILDEVPAVEPSLTPSAIFLGSDNPINVTAVNWFIRDVMPLVQRGQPAFTLTLVGSVCKAVAPTPGVRSLGFVDDLSDAFASAAVNINPVYMGTGVNIKLLDAMMYGMPCITSVTGARGLEAIAGNALSVVPDKDATEFASRVLTALGDSEMRREMALGARVAADAWNTHQQAGLKRWLLREDVSSPGQGSS